MTVSTSTSPRSSPSFDVSRSEDTLIVSPTSDLGSLDGQRFDEELREVVELLDGVYASNILLDLERAPYFGAWALGRFMTLGIQANRVGGRMRVSRVSDFGLQLFRMARLDRVCEFAS